MHAVERDTPKVQEKRAAFLERLTTMSGADLVFVDEMGSHIAMTPTHARSPRGKRALGVVRRNRGSNITTIAALSLPGVLTSFAFPGATDGAVFELFVRDVLVPELRAGQVVVWDNLGAHHRPGVVRAVQAAGCEVWFLPPYSPDLNPIEQCFSKLKTYLRRVGARTVEGLVTAIGEGFGRVLPADVRGWFGHAGVVV